MKAVVQRVLDASVTVSGDARGRISSGLLVYLGVARDDEAADADWLAGKIAGLRIFDDAFGKLNLSIQDLVADNIAVNHEKNKVNSAVNQYSELVNNAVNQDIEQVNRAPVGILAVSQFTLLGDARKGRRPSWDRAAPPEKARALYEYFMAKIRARGLICESGEFQTHMRVSYTNDGPVTILLDSRE